MAEKLNLESSQPGSIVPKKTLKRCPSCGGSNPVAKKRCSNPNCTFEFPKKKKNWNVIDQRGQTNPTHEREKLEYRADVLNKHHDYDIVVLYHRKHGRGHSVFSYATPGKAFSFLGDGTEANLPSKEGRAFLQLFACFCRELSLDQRQSTSSVPEPTDAAQGSALDVHDHCTSDTANVQSPAASQTPAFSTSSVQLPSQPSAVMSTMSSSQTSQPTLSHSTPPIHTAPPVLKQSHMSSSLTANISKYHDPKVSPSQTASTAQLKLSRSTSTAALHSPVIPNKGYEPCEGDKVCIYGKAKGPENPPLLGTGIVMPGRTLHLYPIRQGNSKIMFTSLLAAITTSCPFFNDKYSENKLTLNQFYEWPNEYLWKLYI